MHSDLYDRVLSATITNMLIMSKDNGRIILKDFDMEDESHMYMLHAARIALMNPDKERKIYIDMGPIRFLWFKHKYKGVCEFERYKDKEEGDKPVDIEHMKEFMCSELNAPVNVYKDIFVKYYA